MTMTHACIRLILVLPLGLACGAVTANAKTWPQVVPLKGSFYFKDASEASARVTVRSPSGRSLYLLECHAKGYEGDPEFDYSGDFECRLRSLYSKESYSTLLTDRPDQSRDWESRGRFLVEELLGRCAEYPEFGRLRHFDLRGMRITLEMYNIIIQPAGSSEIAEKKRPLLKSFGLNVVIEPNPKAERNIAAQVNYVEPPYVDPGNPRDLSRKCDVILYR